LPVVDEDDDKEGEEERREFRDDSSCEERAVIVLISGKPGSSREGEGLVAEKEEDDDDREGDNAEEAAAVVEASRYFGSNPFSLKIFCTNSRRSSGLGEKIHKSGRQKRARREGQNKDETYLKEEARAYLPDQHKKGTVRNRVDESK
jgi:hypothetical protein